MRRSLDLAVAAALAVWSSLAIATPADAAESKLTITEVDTSRHPNVSLVVTAPAHVATTDLAGAFSLLESGEEREIDVERVSTDGLEVVVVIDTSGSMQGAPIDSARAAAARFTQSLPAGTPVAVVGFGASVSIALPFSTDQTAQVAAIGALQAAGETALYDAIIAAASLPGDGTARRAIVLLSDGGDTVSNASLEAAAGALRDSGARTTIVELASGESDHLALVQLAAPSGAGVLPVDDAARLGDAYATVTADLLGRYRISYRSSGFGSTPIVVDLASGTIDASATTRLALPAAPAPAPKAKPESTPRSGVEPGFFQSRSALAVGGVCLFAALGLAFGLALAPRRRRITAARLGHSDVASSTVPGITQLAERATAVADRHLEKSGRGSGLDTLIEQGGSALRAGEFVVLTAAATFAALAVGLLFGGLLFGVLLAAGTVLGARTYLVVRRARRQKAFAEQMDDLLQVLASSLRSGYGLMQAIETAGREMESPGADELRRLTTEVRLGRDVADALSALAVRVANEDFEWVTQSILVHREVGGDLAEVLDRVAETIRARGRLKRQVNALTAEGKMSAYILFALPFAIGGMMAVVNPTYLSELFRGVGLVLLGLGVVLMTSGGFWLRKIIRPTY